MKSSIQFISSVGSSLALCLGLHSISQRLDPISSRVMASNAAPKEDGPPVKSAGFCLPCESETI